MLQWPFVDAETSTNDGRMLTVSTFKEMCIKAPDHTASLPLNLDTREMVQV